MKTLDKSNGALVVGIGLDPFFQSENARDYSQAAETRSLLRVACCMARILDSPLHLVSVCEASPVDMAKAMQRLPELDWQHLQLEDLTQLIRSKIQESFEEQLEQVASEIDPDLRVTKQVLNARYPAEGILAEAHKQKALLILLGAGTKADNFFTRIFSTPLSTMADAVVPVLVVGLGCQSDFSHKGLRVVLADDLRDSSSEAMKKAAEWVIQLNARDLLHVHVEELSLERVQQVLGAATAELRSTVEGEKLSADLMHALDASMKERLHARIPDVKELVERRGGTVKTEVRRCSQVRDEIERAAEQFDADVIIFGGHQKAHQSPYMRGRVPYQAMLSQKRAVLVIP